MKPSNLTHFTIKLAQNPPRNKKELSRAKRKWAKLTKANHLIKNSQILKTYRLLVKKGKIKANSRLEDLLRLKKVRSQSGIVPVAVLTKAYPCPGKCVYCPVQKGIPKSYLADEPAVLRAKMFGFDPFKQTAARIEQLQKNGHKTDKIELIIIGGTFSSLPKRYQSWFIKRCFEAANKNQKSKIKYKKYKLNIKKLKEIQRENEMAENRIIGLTLETRPDFINQEEIRWFRKLGCTRVEIGVQSLDDKILKKIKRGHTVVQTAKAIKLLKDAGFKVCAHMMPNLPGSTPQKDLTQFKKLFTDRRFKPDMVKVYPTMVVPLSKLYQWYKKGKFKPYSDKQLIDLLIKIKKIVPPWVRINRLVRDIPAGNIAAGSKLSNMRQILQKKMEGKNIKCQCIRCREIKTQQMKTCSLQLETYCYHASGGKEYFLKFVDDKDRLYGLLRLRLEKKSCFAGVRELHVFGEAVSLGKCKKAASQHKGLGKKLLKKAEKIAKKKGFKELAVIAGIGSRQYYRKLGYKLKDTYMVKKLI